MNGFILFVAVLGLFVFLLLLFWIQRKPSIETKQTGKKSEKGPGLFSQISELSFIPKRVKSFNWGGFAVRLLVVAILNCVVWHFNPLGLWKALYTDVGLTGFKSITIIDSLFVLAAILGSLPKRDSDQKSGAHKAGKVLNIVALFVVFLFVSNSIQSSAGTNGKTEILREQHVNELGVTIHNPWRSCRISKSGNIESYRVVINGTKILERTPSSGPLDLSNVEMGTVQFIITGLTGEKETGIIGIEMVVP